MRDLIVFSYAVLYTLVCVETYLVWNLVHRTTQLTRLSKLAVKPRRGAILPRGTPAPVFSVPLISSDQVLTNADLVGRSTMLLFGSPENAIDPDSVFPFFAHVVWHKSDGNVYFVCRGEAEACEKFNDQVANVMEHRLPVIWDQDGEMARKFKISANPQAVELDDQGCVVRYGGIVLPHDSLGATKSAPIREDIHVSPN